MESSPLTLAHSHARNALFETRKSNPVAASEEHDLAAGEFSTAAQGTLDPDALRTLQLLEKHHKRLAEILRFQHEHPAVASPESTNAPSTLSAAQPSKFNSPSAGGLSSAPTSSLENIHQPPRLPTQHRALQRDTSSIASNLASARGIPSHPPRGSPASPAVSTQNAGAKMAGAPVRTRLEGTGLDALNAELKSRPSLISKRRPSSSPTAISPTDIIDQQTVPSEPSETPKLGFGFPTDESFQRFYSTFEGLISKLSGPLAFASLPLGIDPASQKSAADTQLDRNPASADIASHSTEPPDVNKLVSGAALRALRGRDGSNGSPGHTNPAESFYVVPTAGGTISYAGILSRAEKEARRNSLGDSRDDDFVDARESPLPLESPPVATASGRDRKRAGGRGRGTGALERSTTQAATHPNTKTLEELQMENQALKHLSDTLSKRLHMWEVNAQSSSLALQQSLKAIQHQSTTLPTRQLSPVSSAAPQVSHIHGIQSSPVPAAGPPVPPGEGAVSGLSQSPLPDTARLVELEERARRSEKELQRVGRENEKLRDVVGRYRDRWEKLKEGARVRREGNGSGSVNTNDKGKPMERSKSAATTALTNATAIDERVANKDGGGGAAAGGTSEGGGKEEGDDDIGKGLLDD
ncbi:hypothetical protein GX50_04325 [[Emmonsia] crescens]|uniref:Uncharacterized protein n=1 Tax=[Emmonsia] crescens TaxID=73230 RepID=A0A2B7ZI51_9EURO|nr:hypothetical protein GX50_04325 [Emmonsia crescens]